MSSSVLDVLSGELSKLFRPIRDVVENPLLLPQLLAEIGAESDTAGGDALAKALEAIVTLLDDIDQLSDQAAPSFSEIAGLLKAAQNAFDALRMLSESSGPASVLTDFGSDLIDFLLAAYLMGWHPLARQIAALLTLLDPAESQDYSPPAVNGNQLLRIPFRIDRFHGERISKLLQGPVGTLRDAYIVNDLLTVSDANASANKLFPRLLCVLQALGVSCRYGFTPGDEAMLGDAAPLVDHALLVYAADRHMGATAEAGAVFTFSSADRGDLGLLASPFGSLQLQTQQGAWAIELDCTAQVQGVAYGRQGLTLVMTAASAEATGSFTATLPAPDSGPAFLLGSTEGTRLEVGGAKLAVQTTLSEAAQTLALSADVSKSALVLAPGDGDGFLRTILPAKGLRAEFDLGLAWSNTQGFKVRGAGGLDVTLPVGISAGGTVTVDSIHIGLHADDTGVVAECSASAGLSLGPVQIVIDRMGLLLNLTFPEQGANLGFVNAELGFKAPSGLGTAIDAGPVTGGGFLSFDFTKSEYSGAANLSIEGIGVSAFGLIETQPEVSFLLLIATTFPVPIELGMGFSLVGVGGLAGINRTLALDALETAVWKGTAKDILFPSFPIASAVAILNELDVLFPPAEGRYIFGPTAKNGVGRAALITAEVGVVIELPDPVRIALIGNATAKFPPEKPLVLLSVSFAGGIDFGASRWFFDASLTGSRIESYPLSGDLSVRSAWAEPKSFALAVGGFDRHFQPPAGFPTLSRVALDISNGPLHLHLAAYLAITTNTFQVGAAVDLKAMVCKMRCPGTLCIRCAVYQEPVFVQRGAGCVGVDHGSRRHLRVGSRAGNAVGTGSLACHGLGVYKPAVL